MTHGPAADDIVSLYTSFPWPALCAEVAKLQIELPKSTKSQPGRSVPRGRGEVPGKSRPSL